MLWSKIRIITEAVLGIAFVILGIRYFGQGEATNGLLSWLIAISIQSR